MCEWASLCLVFRAQYVRHILRMDAQTGTATALLIPDRVRHLEELVIQCRLIEAQLDMQGFPRQTRRQLERFYQQVLTRAQEQIDEIKASASNQPSQQPFFNPSDS